ncbi:MAG TPA: DUF2892 domain-containing protein [Polyangiaceae bacterium]
MRVTFPPATSTWIDLTPASARRSSAAATCSFTFEGEASGRTTIELKTPTTPARWRTARSAPCYDVQEGKADRIVRVALGLALLAMVFVGPKTWLGWLGVVPLVTGLIGFCPLYRLIGVRTNKPA